MTKLLFTLPIVLAIAGLSACGGGDSDDHGHDHNEAADHSGHDHGPGGHDDHDHDDHDHDLGPEPGHGGHGKRHELGQADIGGFKVTAASLGEIEAGHEGVLDVAVSGGSPSSVRAWIGVESGQGSLKAKLEKEGDNYHGHVEVPKKLPPNAAVWIEIENADGEQSAASFKLE